MPKVFYMIVEHRKKGSDLHVTNLECLIVGREFSACQRKCVSGEQLFGGQKVKLVGGRITML